MGIKKAMKMNTSDGVRWIVGRMDGSEWRASYANKRYYKSEKAALKSKWG
jgi:hypothetical protein